MDTSLPAARTATLMMRFCLSSMRETDSMAFSMALPNRAYKSAGDMKLSFAPSATQQRRMPFFSQYRLFSVRMTSSASLPVATEAS